MGKPSAGERDCRTAGAEGVFDAVEAGEAVLVRGDFNVWLWGNFNATVTIERAADGGAGLWIPFATIDGIALSWTTAMTTQLVECESGNLWRMNCTSFASGPVNWRISQ